MIASRSDRSARKDASTLTGMPRGWRKVGSGRVRPRAIRRQPGLDRRTPRGPDWSRSPGVSTSVSSSNRPTDMRLGLSELVANGVVHGNAHGGETVDVSISVSDVRIRCQVADQGPGFEGSVWFEIDRARR